MTATDILPSFSPLKLKLSPTIKVPLVSCRVNSFEFETDSFMNPVAPLELPLTKVDLDLVIPVFKNILV